MPKKLRKFKNKNLKTLKKSGQSPAQGMEHVKKIEEGKKLLTQGLYVEAGEIFSSVMKEDPKNFNAIELMGIASYHLGHHETALTFFRALCVHNPSNINQYKHHIACIYRDTNLHDEYIEIILEMPQEYFSSEVHKSLAISYLYIGDKESAEQHYLKALDLDPDNINYLCSYLSQVKDIQDTNDFFLEKLHKKEKSKLNDEEKSRVYYCLFSVYDKLRQHEKALNYALLGAKHKRKTLQYSHNKFLQMFDYSKKYYCPSLYEDYHNDPKAFSTKKPIFIVSMPRSGTTLLEQILLSHPDVETIGEDSFMYDIINSRSDLPMYNNNPYPILVGRNRKQPFLLPHEVAQNYLKHIEKKCPDSKRVIDKSMASFLLLGYIHLAFPNAKIIHIKRDSVDSCLSMFTHIFEGNQQSYTYDIKELTERYCNYVDLMSYWKTLFPDKILDVHYEELVENIEHETKRILEFIEIPWSESCLKFYNNKKAVKTASVNQVRKPIYKNSVYRWKRYGSAIKPLIKALGDYASEEARNYAEKI